MSGKNIPKSLLARVVLRSFLLQASWNFERLQSLGVCYVLAPVMRFLYREEFLAEACSRHLDYFNTHPFMASPVLGTVIALEEKECRGEPSYLGVQEFKKMVMAPYAAMGDALFWGGIRPIAAGIALFFAARESLWAPAAFLVAFNLPHLWLRVSGLFRGYFMGLKVVEVIQRRRLPDTAIRLKEGTVVLLGGLCAYLTFLCLRAEEVAPAWGLIAMPAVILGGKMARKGISTLLLILATSAFILLVVGIF